MSDQRVYAAAEAHARCRGIDLSEWPNQQTLAPDEVRWMREALSASGYPTERDQLREELDLVSDQRDRIAVMLDEAVAERDRLREDVRTALALAREEAARVKQLREALRDLADKHHRTLTGSRLHDPENRDWTDCPCKTCRRAVEALDATRGDQQQHARCSRPPEGWWCSRQPGHDGPCAAAELESEFDRLQCLQGPPKKRPSGL